MIHIFMLDDEKSDHFYSYVPSFICHYAIFCFTKSQIVRILREFDVCQYNHNTHINRELTILHFACT